MSAQELTPWFPPEIKPAYIGVYEVKHPDNECVKVFAHWDGLMWGFFMGTVESALDKRFGGHEGFAPAQDKSWRGLTKEAK
jgi:hypothetical protein